MYRSYANSAFDANKEEPKMFTVSSDINYEFNAIAPQNENVALQKQDKKIPQDEYNFTIDISKYLKVSICKPLIPLKLVQFCWFGGGSFMAGFLTVFLKQRGVSLSQLSWMNVGAPVVQFIGTTLTGIIADKMGRAKPVLVANLLLVITMITGIVLMPSLNGIPCKIKGVHFICFDYDRFLATNVSCEFADDVITLSNCTHQCYRSITYSYNETEFPASIKLTREKISIFSSFIHKNQTSKFNNSCYYDMSSLSSQLIPNTWCNEFESKHCQIDCIGESNTVCSIKTDSLSIIFISYCILYVLFLAAFSNVYRCLDVTAVALAKQYNGDFGRERFFAISGNLVISPLAGIIADVTSTEKGDRNYGATLYLFIGMTCLVLLILYKLPVEVNSPGKKMWKKSFNLLKNPDIVSLAFVILILGTAWNFTKVFVFWYLSDLSSPSVLIGLIPSMSALYGLPFLLSASWWIEKMGCTYLFILAFLSYALKCIGYSYIINPWYSLILEGFGGITYYLLWVAAIIYSHELAPEGLQSTVVVVAGAIHYSIGKASGGLIGGLVMDSFGGRVAFRLIAVICTASAILYGIYLCIRNKLLSKEMKLNKLNKDIFAEKESKHSSVLSNKA